MSKNNATPHPEHTEAASACNTALADMCKALRAFSFYPEGHPLRAKLVHGAYASVSDLVKGGSVSLVVQRDGFAFADREGAIANTPMTAALAQELFAREVQRLSLRPELSLAEFTSFLSLVATDPAKLSTVGGLPAMLKKHGIAAITADEIDITAVFTRKKVGQPTEETVDKGTRAAAERVADDTRSEHTPIQNDLNEPPPEEIGVEELLARMSAEEDDNAYRNQARMLLAKGQSLKAHEEFDRLYLVLAAMAEQHADPKKSQAQRDCSLMVLQQLVSGACAEHLLDHLEDEEFAHKDAAVSILAQAGAEVIDPIIARLLGLGAKPSTKLLMVALSRIGAAALPALTRLLNSDNPQTVHTAVTALGEMRNRDAVKGLSLTLLHFDKRVRTETIRSLARIGGTEATTVLLDLLREEDQSLAVQSIAWLGTTRNQRALQPLLELVMKRDLLGKSQSLKKEAVLAIGRIGDRRALEPLIALVNRRFFIGAARWEQLKLQAVKAIGDIGGDSARVFLEKLATKGGAMGQASSSALATMGRRKGGSNE